MAKQTFKEIRSRYPSQFLVLIDYDERELSSGAVEITCADDVRAFDDGNEMLRSCQALNESGVKAIYCTPNYKDRFVVQQETCLRVMA